MAEVLIIIASICIGSLLSALVALVGSRRTIGFGWAFIISVLFTPIVGIIVVLLTKELPEGEKKWGCMVPLIILLVITMLIALGSLYLFSLAL